MKMTPENIAIHSKGYADGVLMATVAVGIKTESTISIIEQADLSRQQLEESIVTSTLLSEGEKDYFRGEVLDFLYKDGQRIE